MGTKDLLNLSVLQGSEMSLSSHLSCHDAVEGVQLAAYHRTGHFHKFVQAPRVFVCSAASPADNSIEQCILNDSVIKHTQHITADIEGPEPFQEDETALSLPVHCIYVGRPLQFIVQYHPRVFVGLESLYLLFLNAD